MFSTKWRSGTWLCVAFRIQPRLWDLRYDPEQVAYVVAWMRCTSFPRVMLRMLLAAGWTGESCVPADVPTNLLTKQTPMRVSDTLLPGVKTSFAKSTWGY